VRRGLTDEIEIGQERGSGLVQSFPKDNDPAIGNSDPEAPTPFEEPNVPAEAAPPEAQAQANSKSSAVAQTPPERLAPQTSLTGSARDQVNADGELLKPSPRGPLAGLREKLGG